MLREITTIPCTDRAVYEMGVANSNPADRWICQQQCLCRQLSLFSCYFEMSETGILFYFKYCILWLYCRYIPRSHCLLIRPSERVILCGREHWLWSRQWLGRSKNSLYLTSISTFWKDRHCTQSWASWIQTAYIPVICFNIILKHTTIEFLLTLTFCNRNFEVHFHSLLFVLHTLSIS
jgi:hypothetical protein